MSTEAPKKPILSNRNVVIGFVVFVLFLILLYLDDYYNPSHDDEYGCYRLLKNSELAELKILTNFYLDDKLSVDNRILCDYYFRWDGELLEKLGDH